MCSLGILSPKPNGRKSGVAETVAATVTLTVTMDLPLSLSLSLQLALILSLPLSLVVPSFGERRVDVDSRLHELLRRLGVG